MNKTIEIDIVLPCYNPHDKWVEELHTYIKTLQQQLPDGVKLRPIAVNDGSKGCFGVLHREAFCGYFPDAVCDSSRMQNRGKGFTVRQGVALSKADYVLYTDFDVPYAVESTAEVIHKLLEGYDIVIATRNRSYYDELSWSRKILSYGSKWLNYLLLRMKYNDTQGGLKGMSRKGREIMLRTTIDRFLFDTEFIYLASKQKDLTIVEVESHLREGIHLPNMSSRVMIGEFRNFMRIVFS